MGTTYIGHSSVCGFSDGRGVSKDCSIESGILNSSRQPESSSAPALVNVTFEEFVDAVEQRLQQRGQLGDGLHHQHPGLADIHSAILGLRPSWLESVFMFFAVSLCMWLVVGVWHPEQMWETDFDFFIGPSYFFLASPSFVSLKTGSQIFPTLHQKSRMAALTKQSFHV